MATAAGHPQGPTLLDGAYERLRDRLSCARSLPAVVARSAGGAWVESPRRLPRPPSDPYEVWSEVIGAPEPRPAASA